DIIHETMRLRLYNCYVLLVLLDSCDTSTLTLAELAQIENFHCPTLAFSSASTTCATSQMRRFRAARLDPLRYRLISSRLGSLTTHSGVHDIIHETMRLRLYNCYVLLVLLDSCDTSTLTLAELAQIENFHCPTLAFSSASTTCATSQMRRFRAARLDPLRYRLISSRLGSLTTHSGVQSTFRPTSQ
ncbi:hypothetical protein DYB31_010744, partial [Aphanomyces astaci]